MKPALRAMVSALAFVALPAPASAQTADPPPPAHGPLAPSGRFPSHVFTVAPHLRERPEITFDLGLVQPILTHGFNAAVDVRYDRFVFTYSHGQGLEYDLVSGVLTDAQKREGVRLFLPYTTGGGVGVILADELYVLADAKLHHFEARLGENVQDYDTVTVGGEVGWRFFFWKGLMVNPVLRYWPNVWTNVPTGGLRFTAADGTPVSLGAARQGFGGSGFFVNVLVGWAFGV